MYSGLIYFGIYQQDNLSVLFDLIAKHSDRLLLLSMLLSLQKMYSNQQNKLSVIFDLIAKHSDRLLLLSMLKFLQKMYSNQQDKLSLSLQYNNFLLNTGPEDELNH